MARLMNKQSVLAIMNKRISVPENAVGKKVLFTVQGKGTLMDVKTKAGELVQSVVEEGTVFQKVIFNLQANSGIAMKSDINRKLSAEGLKAELAGDFDAAHKAYGAFLNGVQMSFSVPSTSPILAQLGDRVDISARIVKVTTENGSLLTIDSATIRVMEPTVLANTSFSFDDVTADDVPPFDNGETAENILNGNKEKTIEA